MLRAGVVGIGSHCRRNVLPALRHVPVELVAFCDLDTTAAAKVAADYGVDTVHGSLEQLLEKERVDAVFLAVGPHEHPRLARIALDAGVHVWMEKPPAMRAAEVAALIEAAGDLVVVVGFKKAASPAVRKAVELFAQDGVGPVRSMLGIYPIVVPPDGAKVLEEPRLNPWLANSCHPLSALTAVGGRVVAVTTHRAALGGGVCVLEFESGAVGTLHLAHGASSAQPVERYEFYGDGCHLAIENGLRVVFQRGIPFSYGRTESYVPPGIDHGAVVWEPQNMLATLENQNLFTQGIVGSLRHFCVCVREKQRPTIGDLATAYNLMQVYEAALLSDGNRVEVTSC
jgi:predicted dehydrogenase